MKKSISMLLATLTAAVLAGCNLGPPGYPPPATPMNDGRKVTPDPNNVNFNDGDFTTNFVTDNPYNDSTRNASLHGS
jgi:predicted small lipoprotein YifL